MVPHPDPSSVDLASFLEEATRFSDRLVAARCLPSGRFEKQAQDAVSTLQPLLSQWIPDLLLVLRVNGPLRFNRIKERLEPLSSRVLTDKLRDMKTHGFIRRVPRGDSHEYALTEHGLAVATLLHPLLYYLNQDGAQPGIDKSTDDQYG